MLPRRRLLCALLTVLASLVSVLAAATPATADGEPRLRVTVDSQTPYATSATKEIRVSGRVTNTGDVPLSTVNAMLWLDETPLTTRDQLATAAAERPGERLGVRLDEPWELVDEVATTLPPRATRKFEVAVPTDELQLDESGVYVVGVDIRALPPDTSERETWRARSFLPFIEKGTTMTPVEVSFLLPINGRPGLVAGEEISTPPRTSPSRSTTTPDGLPNLKEFGPNGRLSRLLELGSAHDLTFVVDPALLAEAERMADGYTTSNGREVKASETADIRRWLNRARGVLDAGHTLMLPYADPDLPALERHRFTERSGQAVNAAKQTVKDYRASGTLAWPGDGYADAGTLEMIAASGAKTVLLSKHAMPDLPRDGSSPVASLATPEGALTALVVDPALTAGGGPAVKSSVVNVQQRFLSETALLAMQEVDPDAVAAGSAASSGPAGPPGTGAAPAAPGSPQDPQRRVVAVFPRGWNPGAAGSHLFSTVDSTSWLRPVSAAALLSQPPTAYGGPLARSGADERAELSPSVLSQLRELDATTDTVLDLLADPKESRARVDLAFLRGTSMAWRQEPEQAAELIDAIDADLRETITDVSVIPPPLVTLSSRTGRFPVTIENKGDSPVQVQLDVRSTSPDRLKVAPIEPVRVDPNRKVTVRVDAETSGGARSVLMQVGLTTTAGTEFGATESFPVNIRGYGQVGWVIICAGLGLLLLGASTRIFRRVRAVVTRRHDADEGPGEGRGEVGENGDEEGTEQPPPAPQGVASLPDLELPDGASNGQIRLNAAHQDRNHTTGAEHSTGAEHLADAGTGADNGIGTGTGTGLDASRGADDDRDPAAHHGVRAGSESNGTDPDHDRTRAPR
ncbi:DUF6049 family protein [Actinopolymorpha sp. B9G3]|uniref:DUF6049 family protein n=1 Tax=Actinopolymorpha sp. B9G3 TaxID=3158970 RepID=UPI0032D8EBAE